MPWAPWAPRASFRLAFALSGSGSESRRPYILFILTMQWPFQVLYSRRERKRHPEIHKHPENSISIANLVGLPGEKGRFLPNAGVGVFVSVHSVHRSRIFLSQHHRQRTDPTYVVPYKSPITPPPPSPSLRFDDGFPGFVWRLI